MGVIGGAGAVHTVETHCLDTVLLQTEFMMPNLLLLI